MSEDAAFDGEDDELDSIYLREGEAERGFRGLRVYVLAHGLGVACHWLSLSLPKYELYETGSQLRRSAKSVSANIVEGFGRRRYKAEYQRFLVFAKASLDETEEHLEYIASCHPIAADEARKLLITAQRLGERLHRFMEKVEMHHNRYFTDLE